MPNYRRAFCPGGTFFFTLVTFDRRPIFSTPVGLRAIREALVACARRMDFSLDAMVVLPDHLHTIWTLPPGDADFSTRWAMVKRRFTVAWLAETADDYAVAARWQRRRSVWQPRFYEHAIRDERDVARHYDYIHYNPVTHGHAACPHAWAASSFARCVEKKLYPADWLCTCGGAAVERPDFEWADAFEME